MQANVCAVNLSSMSPRSPSRVCRTSAIRKQVAYASTAQVGVFHVLHSSMLRGYAGSMLAVTMLVSIRLSGIHGIHSDQQAHLPTIFSVSDSHPIAICSGRNLPDGTNVPSGEPTYSNSCTIKVSACVKRSTVLILGSRSMDLLGGKVQTAKNTTLVARTISGHMCGRFRTALIY